MNKPEPIAEERVVELAQLADGYELRGAHPRMRGFYPGPLLRFARAIEAERDAAWAARLAEAERDATEATRDVLAERRRQVEAEGWTPEHDDEHRDGSMALAAACYASNAATWASKGTARLREKYAELSLSFRWPWPRAWWKPKSQRQDLVRAGALILAEIERLDRAAITKEQP